MNTTKEIIVITGGTGFAGSHLAELLASSAEYELHLTHVTPVPPELVKLLPTAHFHQLDLTDLQAVHGLFDQVKPTQIYQLASIPIVGDSFARAGEILHTNTSIVHNVLEGVRNVVPKSRVLIVTSAEIYGASTSEAELPINEQHSFRPVNPYGVSKVMQDVLADCYRRSFDLQIVRVRPFNHIGERQPLGFAVSDFAQQIVQIERGLARVLHVGDLTPERDFTDVKDMVRGYQLLMNQGVVGEAYNLGSGRAISMHAIVEQLTQFSTASITIEQEDSRVRKSDIPVTQADASKAHALGWQAEIPLSVTLQRILGYWRGL